jgi:uncharacterized membrane protein YqiK
MLLVNLAAHSTAIEIIVGIVMLAVVLRVGNVVRYIPNDQVGIAEKLWSARGSVEAGFIALAREAGFQPDILSCAASRLMVRSRSMHRPASGNPCARFRQREQ